METDPWSQLNQQNQAYTDALKKLRDAQCAANQLLVEKLFTGVAKRGMVEVSRLTTNGRNVIKEEDIGRMAPDLAWLMLKQEFERATRLPFMRYWELVLASLPDTVPASSTLDEGVPLPTVTPEARAEILKACNAKDGQHTVHPEILDLVIACVEQDPHFLLPGLGAACFGKLHVNLVTANVWRALRAAATG